MSHRIVICMGSSCFARGNDKNIRLIQGFLRSRNIDAEVEVHGERCHGSCTKGPHITLDGVGYDHLTGEALLDLLKERFTENN